MRGVPNNMAACDSFGNDFLCSSAAFNVENRVTGLSANPAKEQGFLNICSSRSPNLKVVQLSQSLPSPIMDSSASGTIFLVTDVGLEFRGYRV